MSATTEARLVDMLAMKLALDADVIFPVKMTAAKKKEYEVWEARAAELLLFIRSYDLGVAKYGDAVYAVREAEVPPVISMAAEFGYKACEKGDNIQMMLGKLADIYAVRPAK